MEIATLIPQEYRDKILNEGIIDKAVAIMTNENMQYLMVIWKQFVEPTLDAQCNLCTERILKCWKTIEPALKSLQKDLLDSI